MRDYILLNLIIKGTREDISKPEVPYITMEEKIDKTDSRHEDSGGCL